jgi:hypothetical protein
MKHVTGFYSLLLALAAMLVSAAASANDGPANASFHLNGTYEMVVIETRWVYSAAEGSFIGGESVLVDSGTGSSDLLVGARLDNFQYQLVDGKREWTAVGEILSISGTSAGARLSDPLTATVLTSPYDISQYESNMQVVYLADSKTWKNGSGEFRAEGITLDTTPEGETFLIGGLNYNFEIAGEIRDDDTNTAVIKEALELTEMLGPIPPADGQVFLKTRIVYVFNGSLVESTITSPKAVPTLHPWAQAILLLLLAVLGGAAWKNRNLTSHLEAAG